MEVIEKLGSRSVSDVFHMSDGRKPTGRLLLSSVYSLLFVLFLWQLPVPLRIILQYSSHSLVHATVSVALSEESVLCPMLEQEGEAGSVETTRSDPE